MFYYFLNELVYFTLIKTQETQSTLIKLIEILSLKLNKFVVK